MNYVQSNTKTGAFQVASASDLTGKEGYLVKMTDASGTPKVDVPAAQTDFAQYVVANVLSSTLVEVIPLTAGTQVRLSVSGTAIVSGSKLVGYGGTAAGLAFPWASGAAFISAVAEESAGTALGFVKARPVLSYYT